MLEHRRSQRDSVRVLVVWLLLCISVAQQGYGNACRRFRLGIFNGIGSYNFKAIWIPGKLQQNVNEMPIRICAKCWTETKGRQS